MNIGNEVDDRRGPEVESSRVRFAWYAVCVGVTVLLTAPAIWRLSDPAQDTGSDIFVHAQMARALVAAGDWFVYSAYYPLNYATTLASPDPIVIRLGTVALLTLIVAGRMAVTLHYAYKGLRTWAWAALVAFVVTLSQPLVNLAAPRDIYLGQLTPNVWHNSTTMLASILVLPAFFSVVALVRSATLRRAAEVALLVTLLTLAKPSFTLALLPAGIVVALLYSWRRRDPWLRVAVTTGVAYLPSLLILGLQTWSLLRSSYDWIAPVQYRLRPLEVWSAFSSNIPLSIALSLPAILLVLVALPRRDRRSVPYVLAWITFGIALLQFSLIGEADAEGNSVLHGVWAWAIVPATSILYFVSCVAVVRNLGSRTVTGPRAALLWLSALAFALHLISGIFYLLAISYLDFPAYSLQ